MGTQSLAKSLDHGKARQHCFCVAKRELAFLCSASQCILTVELDPPILHPHPPPAFTHWWSLVNTPPKLAPQYPDSLLFCGKLRPSHLPSLAPFSSFVPPRNRIAHAHIDLSYHDWTFQSRRDICVLWL